ncbi:FAD:protein FMN transferase [Aquamicrobium segne]|uniref:FAD:protein FMN transferase n=1 Tax=Aquamicrobium segne TaxID=469547 RepID=A0ABW0H0D0_9HYPH
MLTRRRMIAISAAMAASTLAGAARAGSGHQIWTGQALGARASIRLDHPQADKIAARVLAEIERLENILSLYRENSALSRLNRDGELKTPPFELLECLSIASTVHKASKGRFDPTVQPLWALWAQAVTAGKNPTQAEIAQTRRKIGWQKIRFSPQAIIMEPGMALTLNGIGQGYVADRVVGLLEHEGLNDILVDTGEFRALGGRPQGGDWPMRLESGERLGLRQRALATSAPLGTTFDQDGKQGHILNPETGLPIAAVWQSVSISAPSAALADALSTAACLMPDQEAITRMIGQFSDVSCEAAAATV